MLYYVMFKTRAAVFYWHLKPRGTPEVFAKLKNCREGLYMNMLIKVP